MTSDHEQLERPAHALPRPIRRGCYCFVPPSVFVVTFRPLELLPNTHLVIVVDGIFVCMPWGVMERSPDSKDVAEI